MQKRIVIVGHCVIQDPSVTHLAYESDSSLLDADIVVFSPDLSAYWSFEKFQDLVCLDDDRSFALRRQTTHWASELRAALEHGKTVLVHVNKVNQFSIATGDKNFSGTGRNARVTRIVEPFEPYSAIPVPFGAVMRRSGEVIKIKSDLEFWRRTGTNLESFRLTNAT